MVNFLSLGIIRFVKKKIWEKKGAGEKGLEREKKIGFKKICS